MTNSRRPGRAVDAKASHRLATGQRWPSHWCDDHSAGQRQVHTDNRSSRHHRSPTIAPEIGWRRVMNVLSVFSESGLACRIWGAVPGKGYSLMTWRNAADLAEMTALRPGAPGRRNAEAAPEDEALTGMARCRVRSPSPSWR